MSEPMSDRQLLHDCAAALVRLLASPDLHLNTVEEITREDIALARFVLEQVKARLQEVYCVLCGKLIPEVSFTEANRGQLVAYAHRACADKAAQSVPPQQS